MIPKILIKARNKLKHNLNNLGHIMIDEELEPLVSIIILNWNRCDDLVETLNYVDNLVYKRLEVIVVDNGSTDESVVVVRDKFPSVTLIALPINIGCEDGNNVGILNASGEFLLFLDNDADIEATGLCEIINVFKSDKKIGIVEPRIIRPSDGKILNEPNKWPIRNTFVGCAVVIRASVFEKIGLRPGEYFLYSSEPEICLKAVEHGFKIRHCSHIIARHRESPKERASKTFYWLATRNMIWLIWRHYPWKSAVYETLLMLTVHFWRSAGHRAFHYYLLGIFDGALGFKSQAWKKRKPLLRFNEARIFPGYRDLLRIINKKVAKIERDEVK